MRMLAEALDSPLACKSMSRVEITISECAWTLGIFIANESGFRARPPPDSNAHSKVITACIHRPQK
jgi:hypothetical protein